MHFVDQLYCFCVCAACKLCAASHPALTASFVSAAPRNKASGGGQRSCVVHKGLFISSADIRLLRGSWRVATADSRRRGHHPVLFSSCYLRLIYRPGFRVTVLCFSRVPTFLFLFMSASYCFAAFISHLHLYFFVTDCHLIAGSQFPLLASIT